jgi:hypothetical protein
VGGSLLNVSGATFRFTVIFSFTSKKFNNQDFSLNGAIINASLGTVTFSNTKFQDFTFSSSSVFEVSSVSDLSGSIEVNLVNVVFLNISSKRNDGYGEEYNGFGSCFHLINNNAKSKVCFFKYWEYFYLFIYSLHLM